jgi:hypothetical protein
MLDGTKTARIAPYLIKKPGLNERGQLGDGSGINVYTPVPVSK